MFTIAKKSKTRYSNKLILRSEKFHQPIFDTCRLGALKLTTLWLGTLWLTLLSSINAQALPSDSQQPITIQSDRAIRDEKTGLTIYEGNVKITQGSLIINADNITLYNDERGLYKVIAHGKPAQFHQQPEVNKAIISAKGETIEYLAEEQMLHLSTHASLNQDGTLMQGDSINYDIAKQLVTATGSILDVNSNDFSTDKQSGQIKIVIPPNTIATPNVTHQNTPDSTPPTNKTNETTL